MRLRAAFFDIDGTLYREALLTQMFKKMINSDMIEQSVYNNEVKELYRLWRRRKGDYDDYLIKMAEIYIESIKGLHYSQIEYVANKVIEQYGENVYTYTRDRIEWHKAQNHKVIAVSGAPIELVKAMAKKYGFEDYIGTHYELNAEQVYTGKYKPMWDSQNKKEAIADFVKKYKIALAYSFAYGDTNGDFDMLRFVGNPVAINPTKELLMRISKDEILSEKIKIVVERKDMVYQLDASYIKTLEEKMKEKI
jgi:HAD superfamily hydrolase (TIGR01490 family)